MIWWPIRISGLSENFGSCRIIEIRLPRIVRICRSDAAIRSMPSKRSRLAVTWAAFGVSFRIERPVSDLPEPDSPTIPTFSRPIENEMPRTAWCVRSAAAEGDLEIFDFKQAVSHDAGPGCRAVRHQKD